MNYSIQTKSLRFGFSKDKAILKDLSINVPQGSIYGFLGPNGAGKSTTMRLLTGIIPDENRCIKIFDENIVNQMPFIFNRIGALVESPALYLHLSGYDNLRYLAKIRGVSEAKITEVLELVDLSHAQNQKAKQYSLGMKQRLAIAMALLHEPELLLLDEPVNGLDPYGIIDIRKLLITINQERGVTVFISSHLLSEVEKLCTHVGIIADGELKFEGNMKELSSHFNKCKIHFEVKNAANWVELLKAEYSTISLIDQNSFWVALSDKSEIPNFNKMLFEKGAEIFEIKIKEGLEEWFMSLTKKN